MKYHLGLNSLLIGVVVLAAQPGWTAATQVTGIQVNPTSGGVDVVLATQTGQRPQVFTVSRGNSWVADVINTQLQLPQGKIFRQDNPAPGISSVVVVPLDSNSIRVSVTGESGAPSGQITRRETSGMVLSLNRAPADQAAVPSDTPPPTTTAQRPLPPASSPPPVSSPPPTAPNPNLVPPSLPRAIAPPVGDITTSTIDITATSIDLGTAERVPRLVLRDAPVREVLSLLARAAGLNVAFAEGVAATTTPGQTPTPPGQPTTPTAGTTISLDIENEPVQDVFNYVLRISNLQANREGRTIFVGQTLPGSARGLVMRTLRLNQLKADLPLTNITSTTNSASLTSSAGAGGGGGTGGVTSTSNSTVGRTATTSQNVPLKGAIQLLQDLGATTPGVTGAAPTPVVADRVLSGLTATADSRTNTVTLIGTQRQIEIASSYLTQLDVRKRQVAVNVKIVQVTLDRTNSVSTNFSFGVVNNFFVSQGGLLQATFGGLNPPSATAASTGISPPIVSLGSVQGGITDPETGLFQYPGNFLLSLQAQVRDNNAKVLTDPTLIVQEGTQAQVNLTQQLLTNLQQQVIVPASGAATTTLTTQFTDVGVILNVAVDQIDDNGFVTMAVSPEVSSAGNPISISLPNSGGGSVVNSVVPVNRRRLETGTVRLRDGQTLVLTGIISEQEQVIASKIPILGDLPIIGALFRSSSVNNNRTEVVVLVTPQVMDDSEQSGAGYSYTPGSDVRQILQRANPNKQP